MFKVPEHHRILHGPAASDASYGNNGAFFITIDEHWNFQVIASDGEGWEHVSVLVWNNHTGEQRTPIWDHMCFIKNLFWDEQDAVVQYHPPLSEYVNNHEHVLHLWRPIGVDIPRPPFWMVGVKSKTNEPSKG